MNYFPNNGMYQPANTTNQQWGQAQQSAAQQPLQQNSVNEQPSFVCHPVASYEEACAYPTDFSGKILLLADLYNGMIYMKMLDPKTGRSQFASFQYVAPPQPATPPAYVTQEEMGQLADQIAQLRAELEESRKTLGKKATGKGNE